MALPIIRLSRPTDINDVMAMDLRCYHYPTTLEQWREFLHKSGRSGEASVMILEMDRKPVGFSMWQKIEGQGVQIAKLGVLPKYRRLGLGKSLITKCEGEASWGRNESIFIWVPDLCCRPGDPDDVSAFLHKCGYLATGETRDGQYRMYGDRFEYYKFEKSL